MSTASPNPSLPEETKLWEGHTSQWVHIWFYLLCFIAAAGIGVLTFFTGGLSAIALVIPFVAFVARWWVTKSTSYELTSQRLRKVSGILTRQFEDLELFRVKDYTIEQPLFLRMVGLGNVVLVTSDSTTPTVHIKAIPDALNVREMLRTAVQLERDRKRVRELDVDGGTAGLA